MKTNRAVWGAFLGVLSAHAQVAQAQAAPSGAQVETDQSAVGPVQPAQSRARSEAAQTAAARAAATAVSGAHQPIDLVICLDTSGSMQGLLDAARQKLWAIANDLALARPAPRLRVALLTYGNDGLDPAEGWVAIQTPLTDDLDLVSQKLFEQTLNGGTELVGRVMQTALDSLQFDPAPNALKLLFVAGNESADQDTEAGFREMCRRAIGQGIMVNSIYCGDPTDDIAPDWHEIARLADGYFASIDQEHGTVVITTPFDSKLVSLSSALNGTYVPFGAEGLAGSQNQALQDSNASAQNSAAAAQRAACKGGSLYVAQWDLVDACRTQRVKLEEVDKADLPEDLRPLSDEALQQHLDAKQAERTRIQEEIAALDAQREAFVTEELARRAQAAGNEPGSFEEAVRTAIRCQAEKKGFQFAPPVTAPSELAPPVTAPPVTAPPAAAPPAASATTPQYPAPATGG